MPLPVRPRAVRVGGHRVRTVRVSAQAAATSTFVDEPEQREHVSGLNVRPLCSPPSRTGCGSKDLRI